MNVLPSFSTWSEMISGFSRSASSLSAKDTGVATYQQPAERSERGITDRLLFADVDAVLS